MGQEGLRRLTALAWMLPASRHVCLYARMPHPDLPLPLADIEPGQGLYYETLTKRWRVKNCEFNEYGVTNFTYGLTPAPCVPCPMNMVTNVSIPASAEFYTQNPATGSSGFISPLACVTAPGAFRVSVACVYGAARLLCIGCGCLPLHTSTLASCGCLPVRQLTRHTARRHTVPVEPCAAHTQILAADTNHW